MPPEDFVRFWLLDQVEPLGERRGDFQAAMIVAAVLNLFKDPKKDNITSPLDCMPDWEGIFKRLTETPEQKAARQLKMMLIMQQFQNAKMAAESR